MLKQVFVILCVMVQLGIGGQNEAIAAVPGNIVLPAEASCVRFSENIVISDISVKKEVSTPVLYFIDAMGRKSPRCFSLLRGSTRTNYETRGSDISTFTNRGRVGVRISKECIFFPYYSWRSSVIEESVLNCDSNAYSVIRIAKRDGIGIRPDVFLFVFYVRIYEKIGSFDIWKSIDGTPCRIGCTFGSFQSSSRNTNLLRHYCGLFIHNGLLTPIGLELKIADKTDKNCEKGGNRGGDRLNNIGKFWRFLIRSGLDILIAFGMAVTGLIVALNAAFIDGRKGRLLTLLGFLINITGIILIPITIWMSARYGL